MLRLGETPAGSIKMDDQAELDMLRKSMNAELLGKLFNEIECLRIELGKQSKQISASLMTSQIVRITLDGDNRVEGFFIIRRRKIKSLAAPFAQLVLVLQVRREQNI